MVKLKVQPNELPEEIYEQSRLTITKIVIAAVVLFFLAFFFNFPISKIIKTSVVNALATNRACPITYDDLRIEWFTPKIILKKPVISGVCFNNPGGMMKLNDLALSLQMPSVWPIGLKFHTKIKHKLTVLNIYPTIGMNRQVIKIDKSSISHETLLALLGKKSLKFSGDFEIEALVNINQGNLTSGDVIISSTNLNIPPQNVAGLVDLPALPISQLQIKSSVNAKNLIELKDIRIGNSNSPIIALIDGNIKLNPHNTDNSTLDLVGEVKFSQTILESFALLNAMLSGRQPSDKGFYKFKVGGRLSSPVPSFQ
ncbi:type II secretion system protein GspN [Halobacteriovorax sp. HLS]|uniref:type II secretion system protein GspN n=1 Tax=Halobacteriovorax sp. HLS TaxID=2234000 RepID=UPI000FDAE569|nr:type II secretion system protein GspN [Halobacteriovorax sp. HLS]